MSQVPTLRQLGLALALLSPAAFAQATQDSHTINYHSVQAELGTWNADHGSHWRIYTDRQTGFAEFLHGGSSAAAFEPTTDADFADLGMLAIEQTAGIHGIEPGTLLFDSSLHLPLGMTNSNDKFTVRYRQEVNGVPVLAGYVNTLFNMNGDLLSVQTNAMPGVAGMSTAPSIAADTALNVALTDFESEFGLRGQSHVSPKLAIGQLESGTTSREAVLIWEINVSWTGKDMEPEGQEYWISAHDGSVVRQRTNIHHCDVGGTVSTMATPGIGPDTSLYPEISFPMNHVDVTAPGQATVQTDEFGAFNFAGVTGPLSVTFRYRGDWTEVFNDPAAGGHHAETMNLTGTTNAVTLNTAMAAQVTAQANIFVQMSAMRDWIKSVNPSDNSWVNGARANANLASTCNAYFDGSSINFFLAGGGCPNTAYSTVVAHEMGHWLNVRHGTGNGPDGIGEGNADVYSLYMYNTPNLGMDFQGPSSGPLRSGNNGNAYCGDTSPACYGQVHADGQPWMGAAWKVYLELEAAFGAAEADMVSDQLFLGWMNAYDQTGIASVIEAQWLTLDDDDGNIDNGTPHMEAVDAGFQAQGFPGLYIARTAITLETTLEAQNSEFGPYVIEASATSLIGNDIESMDLVYTVDGGNSITLNMTPTTGDSWTVGIPGHASPSVVQFFLRAVDSNSHVEISPRNAPERRYNFGIGVEEVILASNFQTDDPNWTTGTLGGTSNLDTDWQRTTPTGLGGDPWVSASGTRHWGNTVQYAPSQGALQGIYPADMNAFLLSPSMNLNGASRVLLRFNRWLAVESSSSDTARIAVYGTSQSGTDIWTNSLNSDTIDREWTSQFYDITDAAAGSNDVRVEFSLKSNGTFNYGGWNLDDFEVVELKPVTSVCQASIPYGIGKENSEFAYPFLRSISEPSVGAGTFNFRVRDAIPNRPGVIFSSPTADNNFLPAFQGTLLVGPSLQREGTFFTDSSGEAVVPQGIATENPGGIRFYQAWYRDPNHWDGTGAGLSDGLQVIFCN